MKRRLVLAAAVAVSSCAFAQAPNSKAAASPPATAPVLEAKSFQLQGTNDEWTSSTVRCEEGDLLMIMVSGTVKFGEFVGVQGPGNNNVKIKIGTTGPRYLVLSSVQLIPPPDESPGAPFALLACRAAGTVKMMVADTKYGDNAGAFDVMILRMPKGSLPEPTVVKSDD